MRLHMTGLGPKIDGPRRPAEALSQLSRRGLLLILAAIMMLGGTAAAMAVAPASLLARWPAEWPWLIPGATLAAFIVVRVSGGRGWPRASQNGNRDQANELRQQRLARAHRAALILTLVAQIPLALMMNKADVQNAAMGMATTTITIGLAAMVTCFLVFDRN